MLLEAFAFPFGYRKRQQVEQGEAPGERIGDFSPRHRAQGAREPEETAVIPRVEEGLKHREKRRHPLDLINDGVRRTIGNQLVGRMHCGVAGFVLGERYVRSFAAQLLHELGLSRLPHAGEKNAFGAF